MKRVTGIGGIFYKVELWQPPQGQGTGSRDSIA